MGCYGECNRDEGSAAISAELGGNGGGRDVGEWIWGQEVCRFATVCAAGRQGEMGLWADGAEFAVEWAEFAVGVEL